MSSGVFDAAAKPLEGPPLPVLSAFFYDYACPTCGVQDWTVRPDGTMTCYHCAIHLQLSKNWCPYCGTMRG